ncbi:MAG: hypothetical protein HYW23_01380 [Candidatus Aenigmarchaeota archaeon]|nr:hypothetical protein [Candidatus Aenigmarchaeota archaeon]
MKRKTEYPGEIYKEIEKYRIKYRNLLFIAMSLVAAYLILTNNQTSSFIGSLGNLGYVSAFIVGLFFTFAFTTAPATVAFFDLGHFLNPVALALIGAAGSVISDYLIFRLVRDRLFKEIQMLSKEVDALTKPISSLFFWKELQMRIWHGIRKSEIWHVIVPAFAGFIIASPLPDEIGVAIFGAVKFNPKKFIIITFVLHFIGILLVAMSARIL